MRAELRSGVLAAGLLVAASAPATASEPALELEASPSAVRVGDPVEVVAAARGGDGWLWGEPAVAVTPDGPWALAGGPTPVAGVRPPAWKLVLVPLALGEQELPEVAVSARSPGGETVEVRSPDPPRVAVTSVLDAEEASPEPAPLRDPIGARGFAWEWLVPALLALLPLLAGAAWWWRGRGLGDAAGRGRPVLPPVDELRALLAELERRVGREPAESVCDRLAAGLRRYLERRTGEPAAEMTSFELRLLARRRGWPETGQRLVQRVMAVADGARFGRRPTGDAELRAAIGDAGEAARVVEGFMAAAEAPAEAGEGGR
ncbi:MAG TPA: hypothetical protein VLB51_11715 [Methylomirabilota bacterium]|nr:hypothetical protein [Methylomirabilota bacterium]